MKKIIAFIAIALIGWQAVSAQDLGVNFNNVRRIDVSGTAEICITPDIIYVDITLQEYMKDKTNKVTIATLQEQLAKAVANAGIKGENLTVADVSGDVWKHKKKKEGDFITNRRFRLKLTSLDPLDKIMNGVDDSGITDVSIAEITHTKIEEYRAQVKVKALQAAKAKASSMLEGIGEHVGGLLTVVEQTPIRTFAPMQANAYIQAQSSDNMEAASTFNFRTIKVTSTVDAVFEIKQ